MLRLHLSDADVARVRIKAGPAPLTETVLSLEALRNRQEWLGLQAWRLAARQILSPRWRVLTELVQPDHLWPEFLAPRSASPDVTDGLELLRATPSSRIGAAMRRLARLRRLTPDAAHLARGDAQCLTRLADAASAYFQAAIAPHWQAIRAVGEADVASRARTLAAGGVHALLSTLHPTVIWREPILHLPSHLDADIRLRGQGLTLVPSFFNRTTAIGVPDQGMPLLVYPIVFDLPTVARIWHPVNDDNGLTKLLGRTRARALEVTASGCTTGELARRVGISPATASEHISVLRQAGLIVTNRHHNFAVHTITQLGQLLLRSTSDSN